MALSEIVAHLDFVQLLIVPLLILVAVGFVACGRFKIFFSDRRGKHSPATVIKGVSESVPEAFIRYRSGKYAVDTDRDHDIDNRRTFTQELDDGFQEDLNTVIQRFSRLSLNNDKKFFKYDKSVFQDEIDELAKRLERLRLTEKEEVNWCPLEEVVIDYRCVTDRRRKEARQNVRRMLREREKKARMAVQKAEEERWARAEELERQRVLKAKEEREKKDLMMQVTGKGLQLLQCRRKREQMRSYNCLRILLHKSQSGDPWMKPYLRAFE